MWRNDQIRGLQQYRLSMQKHAMRPQTGPALIKRLKQLNCLKDMAERGWRQRSAYHAELLDLGSKGGTGSMLDCSGKR